MSDVHYGIYRGICKENEDPENYKRIKLIVPQVLGNALSEWAWPVGEGGARALKRTKRGDTWTQS